MMNRRRSISDMGMATLVILSVGVLASRLAYANPAQCITGCTETKYIKTCALGTYVFYTKPTCRLCNNNVSSNCDDIGKGQHDCKPKGGKMGLKVITSTEFCACTVGNTNYSYAQAHGVDAGQLPEEEFDREECVDPPPGPDPPIGQD
jgi:hypothetical protein